MAGLSEGSLFVGLILTCLGSHVDASSSDKLQLELMARMKALEQQGREQAATLEYQAAAMKAMETKLESQNARIQDRGKESMQYKHRIEQLETTIKDLQKIEHVAEAEDHPDTGSGNDVKLESSSMTRRGFLSEKPRRLVVDGESPIAFHAVVKKGVEVGHIGIGQKIVFPDVQLNLGGGYMNQHGIFTAPVPGVYIFSTSIMSYTAVGRLEIYVNLMKNGQVLANAYAHGDSGRHDQGSVSVVTQLATGDQVWVSLYGIADTSMWGDNFDSFMGCLIFGL